MGYTHYWRGQRSLIDPVGWQEAVDDCIKIIINQAVPLRLQVSFLGDARIWVNGDEECGEDHETFEILANPSAAAENEFDFCKTAQKPYDVVVTACLARLAEAGLWVDSDGDRADWDDGLRLAEKVIGRKFKFPLDLRR